MQKNTRTEPQGVEQCTRTIGPEHQELNNIAIASGVEQYKRTEGLEHELFVLALQEMRIGLERHHSSTRCRTIGEERNRRTRRWAIGLEHQEVRNRGTRRWAIGATGGEQQEYQEVSNRSTRRWAIGAPGGEQQEHQEVSSRTGAPGGEQ